MRQGSTPILSFEVSGYDLSYASHIWVTLDQSGTQIVRKWYRYPDESKGEVNKDIMVSGQFVVIRLTQEETLGFDVGRVEAQIKFKEDDFDEEADDDNVVVTEIKKIKVTEGINEDVM